MPTFLEGHPGWSRSLFVLILFILMLISVPGHAVTEVGLLTWKSSELYEKAIEALQEKIRDDLPGVVLVRRDANCSRPEFYRYLKEFSSNQVKALVLLGSTATRMVVHSQEAETALPSVALCVSDPVCLDLEGPREDVGYPLTGVSYFIPLRKHLSLFSHLYPEVRRLAFLYDPDNPAGSCVELPEIERAGRALGLEVFPLAVETAQQLDGCVKQAVAHTDLIVLASNKLIFGKAGQIALSAGDVPVFSLCEEAVPAGAVAALYADRGELGRIAAGQVKQILAGTPAREIPFYYPLSEKLSVNLSSARRWGIMIPRQIMERPSMAWRSSNCPEWYREDGSLKGHFLLENDPDDRSFLRVGVICQSVAESRPFLAGVFQGLQLGSSNYEVEMSDAKNSIERANTTLETYRRDVDLIVTVGGDLIELVKDRHLPVPVVFTGASVSEVMPLAWRNRRITGSTYFLDQTRQVSIMEDLFGADVPYLLVRPFDAQGQRGENHLLYLEMLTSGFDVERVSLSPVLSPQRQADRLFLSLSERILRGNGMAPVLVVPNGGEVYRCLPDLGRLLVEAHLSVPVYVTSAWGLRWGGTVSPDVDPEDVGLVAGRYVTQILEQGIYPKDLPVWGGGAAKSICVNRRWKEISDWIVPSTWSGNVREIVTEAQP